MTVILSASERVREMLRRCTACTRLLIPRLQRPFLLHRTVAMFGGEASRLLATRRY